MTDGASTAVDNPPNTPRVDDTDETTTLCHDMRCILVEATRDRALSVFRPDAPREALDALADTLARSLAPRIGGRYVPKRDDRAARDAAVLQAFTGRNHLEVQRKFAISRRLLYSILARKRKHPAVGA